jgi:hypothetical protein
LTSGGEVSQREIELWIQHIGPVWKQSKEAMEGALVSWEQVLRAEGLRPPGENQMEKFILEGIK